MIFYSDSSTEYIQGHKVANKPHLRPENQSYLPKQRLNNSLWSSHPIHSCWKSGTTVMLKGVVLRHHCPTLPQSATIQCILDSLILPTHPPLLLNPFIPSIIYTQCFLSINTIILSHSPLFLHNPIFHTTIPRTGISELLQRSKIFFYGKWCTTFNSDWKTWQRWSAQLQQTGANQLIHYNQLKLPRTQHKTTKAHSSTEMWYLNWQIMKMDRPSHFKET